MLKSKLLIFWFCVLFPFITFAHFDKVEWLSIEQSNYVNPIEIAVEKHYRFTVKPHQLVYFKFQKDLLEPNQKYLIETVYPGVVSLMFFIIFNSSLA